VQPPCQKDRLPNGSVMRQSAHMEIAHSSTVRLWPGTSRGIIQADYQSAAGSQPAPQGFSR
jgi:hypothetical protein